MFKVRFLVFCCAMLPVSVSIAGPAPSVRVVNALLQMSCTVSSGCSAEDVKGDMAGDGFTVNTKATGTKKAQEGAMVAFLGSLEDVDFCHKRESMVKRDGSQFGAVVLCKQNDAFATATCISNNIAISCTLTK